MNAQWFNNAGDFWKKVEAGQVSKEDFMQFMEEMHDAAREQGFEEGQMNERSGPY